LLKVQRIQAAELGSAACFVLSVVQDSGFGVQGSGLMNFTDEPISYRARTIVAIDGSPIDDGRLVVVGEQIVELTRGAGYGRTIDLGEVVLLPGLVNAHTHLEFSGLAAPLGTAGASFSHWLHEVIAYRREGTFQPREAMLAGLAESAAAGVTSIGDIATVLPELFFDRPPGTAHVTSFAEFIGLGAVRAEAQAARLSDLAARCEGDDVRRGLSPHAPYTVRRDLFEAIVRFGVEHALPLAFHLAESPDELQMLARGDGPLVELMQAMGVWDCDAVPRGSRPLDYLRSLAGLQRGLVIHGNYLDNEEIAFLATHADRLTTIYCPRTHAYFGHERHPLPKLLAAGAAVALGTDGRCTNPDLDLLAEMRQVARAFPELSAERIVRLGTIDGAAALGITADCGSLRVGKRADFVALSSPSARDDPYEAVLDPRARVVATFYAGRPVFRAEG
jgi:cytosine/adenosine deaminase-related metal-dependent hydrolase